MDREKVLLIVYHSQSGHTELLSRAVEEGAMRVPSIKVSRLTAAKTAARDLMSCRALIVCSPEYFGYMAGAVKELFDRTYEEARDHTGGKSCALVVSAGNDGTGALNSMERILKGYRVKMVQEPVISRGPVTETALEQCRTLGETVAAGMDLGIY